MEEDKKTDFVKDKEIVVNAIELESNPNNAREIVRVRFKTDIGDITCKPKMEQTEMICGMKKISQVPITDDKIPNVLIQMAKEVNIKGFAKYKNVSYGIMKTKDAEGEEKIYRFINSLSMIEKWELVLAKITQEEKIE